MPEQTPSIGRVVHYVLRGEDLVSLGGSQHNAGAHRPATIVEVRKEPSGHEWCFLSVTLTPTDSGQVTHFIVASAYMPDGDPGTWHWPERV